MRCVAGPRRRFPAVASHSELAAAEGVATWYVAPALALGASMAGTATLPRTGLQVAARRSRRLRVAWPDVLIALALGTIAFIVRRHVPDDGLFYDDAWQALGAWKGSFSELISVGQAQPGFTAGLMVWTRLFGVGSGAMVTPALIAGTLGPPALYIVLRRFDFSRSIALLAGAALSSAQVHIEYSYHIKTYTFDVLIVLGLAFAVWQLARLRWRTSTAMAWCIGSIIVGSFSSIALIARRSRASSSCCIIRATACCVFSPHSPALGARDDLSSHPPAPIIPS